MFKYDIMPLCCSEQSIMAMKTKFEKEIADWKIQLTEAQSIIAQLKLQLENIQQDNKKLNTKYDKLGGQKLVLIGYQRLVSFRKEAASFMFKVGLTFNNKNNLTLSGSMTK